MIKALLIILLTTPLIVFAADKPSMTSMWLELVFLAIMLVVLKIAHFSNKNKLILFITYILAGIISQTIWLPVILFIVMYTLFNKNSDDDSYS
ncbi:hypothetical protein MNBD_GAMMA01-1659 [hydrothermal vent metagenome]|uniref:Uncharacterized protein n=1 Tax=hydrothermal vent metagenome TaxID=652676 RepID=A0A3B0VNP3_9ZZZZ